MMSSWCQQVNWENCGIPWVNCAVLCSWKTTGKDSSEFCIISCQNCAVYSVFLSGMTSHNKIAQFNWQCIWRLRLTALISHKISTFEILEYVSEFIKSVILWRNLVIISQEILPFRYLSSSVNIVTFTENFIGQKIRVAHTVGAVTGCKLFLSLRAQIMVKHINLVGRVAQSV